MSQQGLQLRAEEQTPRHSRDVERLDSQTVARQKQAAPILVPEHDRELPHQALDGTGPALLVKVDHDLRVGLRPEGVRVLQGAPELAMVVDFAIDADEGALVFVPDWLGAASDVDDGQATEYEREVLVVVELLVVGPSVGNLRAHPTQNFSAFAPHARVAVESDEASKTAHDESAEAAVRSLSGSALCRLIVFLLFEGSPECAWSARVPPRGGVLVAEDMGFPGEAHECQRGDADHSLPKVQAAVAFQIELRHGGGLCEPRPRAATMGFRLGQTRSRNQVVHKRLPPQAAAHTIRVRYGAEEAERSDCQVSDGALLFSAALGQSQPEAHESRHSIAEGAGKVAERMPGSMGPHNRTIVPLGELDELARARADEIGQGALIPTRRGNRPPLAGDAIVQTEDSRLPLGKRQWTSSCVQKSHTCPSPASDVTG